MPAPPSRIAEHEVAVLDPHRHLDLVGAGVADDVVQRLRADPVAGHLDGGGQPRRVVVREPGAAARASRPAGAAPRPARARPGPAAAARATTRRTVSSARRAASCRRASRSADGIGLGAHERPQDAQLHGQPGQRRARRRRAGPAAAAAAPPRAPGPAAARPARSSSVSSTAWTATPPCRPRSVSSRSSSACSRRPAPGATVSVPTGVAPETRSAARRRPPPGRVPHSPVSPPALGAGPGHPEGGRGRGGQPLEHGVRAWGRGGSARPAAAAPGTDRAGRRRAAGRPAAASRDAQRLHGEGAPPGDDRDAEGRQVPPEQLQQCGHQDGEPADARRQHGVDERLPHERRDHLRAPAEHRGRQLRPASSAPARTSSASLSLRQPGVAEDDQQHERRRGEQDADHPDPLVGPGPPQPDDVRGQAQQQRHLQEHGVESLDPGPDLGRKEAHGVGDGPRGLGEGGVRPRRRAAHRGERRQGQALDGEDRADERPPAPRRQPAVGQQDQDQPDPDGEERGEPVGHPGRPGDVGAAVAGALPDPLLGQPGGGEEQGLAEGEPAQQRAGAARGRAGRRGPPTPR